MVEGLPETLKGILAEVGRWSQQAFPYQGKCLQWINAQYQALTRDNQNRVNAMLRDTGCEALLNSASA